MALKFDKEGLLAAFKKHADDRGKADSLNLIEFGEMMIELVGHEAGYTVEDFTAMFDGVRGSDDEVTFDEMWNAITAKPATEKQLRATFASYDSDGSGQLTADELKAALSSMPNPLKDEEIEATIAAADKGGDGKISIDEFLACWGK